MCYEHIHSCQYCGHTYECDMPNEICPTINFDKDKKMCADCRKELEDYLNDRRHVSDKIKLMIRNLR